MSPSGASFSTSQAKVQYSNSTSTGFAQGARGDLHRGSHLCLANWRRMRGGTDPAASWILTPHTIGHTPPPAAGSGYTDGIQ